MAADAAIAAGAPLEAVYRFERDLLDPQVIVPVVHMPELAAVAPQIEWWSGPPILPSGGWDFASVWIRADKP
jgi:hypothetical protein